MRLQIRVLIIDAVIILLSSFVISQTNQADYGDPSELKGIKKIFVKTGPSSKARKAIIKELTQKLPHLVVVDIIEDAEAVLDFTLKEEIHSCSGGITMLGGLDSHAGGYGSVNHTRPLPVEEYFGRGLIYLPRSNQSIRVLMEYTGSKASIFDNMPSENFAEQFIKAYKKANK